MLKAHPLALQRRPPAPPCRRSPLSSRATDARHRAKRRTDGGRRGRTVLVPPPTMGAPPPAVGGPQVRATPTAMPPADDPSPGLGEAFAVEAGERELAMDPGDHTVLLGANDFPDVPAPPATPPGASDDIWSDAGSSVSPLQPVTAGWLQSRIKTMERPSSWRNRPTINMPAPPGEASLGGPVDNEMSVGDEDPDATWQMPSSTPEIPPGFRMLRFRRSRGSRWFRRLRRGAARGGSTAADGRASRDGHGAAPACDGSNAGPGRRFVHARSSGVGVHQRSFTGRDDARVHSVGRHPIHDGSRPCRR